MFGGGNNFNSNSQFGTSTLSSAISNTIIETGAGGEVDSVNTKKGDVILTTSDISEGTNLYYTNARVSANSDVINNTTNINTNTTNINTNTNNLNNFIAEKDAVNGICPLDGMQRVPLNRIPDSLKTSILTVADIDARNALLPITGDIVKVSSNNLMYIFNGSWLNLSLIESVNTQTGEVILDTDDITEGSTNLYYTNTRVSANSDVISNINKVQNINAIANETTINGLLKCDTIDLQNNNIINSSNPTNAQDITTKYYVDNLVQGLTVKECCIVASTVDLDSNSSISGVATYNNTGGDGSGQITATLNVSDVLTVDGVSFSSSDNGKRILLKNQANAKSNGIWLTTISGNSLTLNRSNDFNESSDVSKGAFMFICQGTINSDIGFILITDNPTIGTVAGDDLIFTQFTGVSNVEPGDGIQKNANLVSVDLKTNGGLVIESAKIALDLGATNMINTLDSSKIADGSVSNIEFQYINSLSSNAQNQINDLETNKLNLTGGTITGPLTVQDININGSILGDSSDNINIGSTIPGTDIIYPLLAQTSNINPLVSNQSSIWNSGFEAWKAHDKDINTFFLCADNKYTGDASGTYLGAESTNGYAGEWTEITLNEAHTIVSINIKPRIGYGGSSLGYPKDFKLFGSSDGGSSWTELLESTGNITVDDTINNYVLPSPAVGYSTFRLVTNSITGSASIKTVQYSVLEFVSDEFENIPIKLYGPVIFENSFTNMNLNNNSLTNVNLINNLDIGNINTDLQNNRIHKDGSIAMTGNLDINNNNLSNVNLINGIDYTTRNNNLSTAESNITDLQNEKINRDGSIAMIDDLNLGGNNLINTNLINGLNITTLNTNITNLQNNRIHKDGSIAMTGALDMNNNNILNVNTANIRYGSLNPNHESNSGLIVSNSVARTSSSLVRFIGTTGQVALNVQAGYVTVNEHIQTNGIVIPGAQTFTANSIIQDLSRPCYGSIYWKGTAYNKILTTGAAAYTNISNQSVLTSSTSKNTTIINNTGIRVLDIGKYQVSYMGSFTVDDNVEIEMALHYNATPIDYLTSFVSNGDKISLSNTVIIDVTTANNDFEIGVKTVTKANKNITVYSWTLNIVKLKN